MEARLDPVPGIEEGGRLSSRTQRHAGISASGKSRVLEPLVGGWHDTGDIVTIDAAGFHRDQGPRQKLPPRSRARWFSLSRSKPWLSALWPQAMSVAVSIPDARKGERIDAADHAEGCRALGDATPRQGPQRVRTGGAGGYRVVGNVPLLVRQDRLCRRDQACSLELATPAEPAPQTASR